ncbi:MAG: hypothetical protein ABIS50_17745 [Luteolibacter sp.]|uniref:hypothetical protein n=1 Tax=Luteolibacter sp. TaxID=1962973 RepID=UPI003263B544
MKIEAATAVQSRESNQPARTAGDLSDQQIREAEVPESARHAAGEIERHQQSGLAALDEAVRDQEAKVEERRKVLATIVRNRGIIHRGQDSFYGQSGTDEDQVAKNALQTYNDLQTQKMQLESQINS